MRPDGRPSTASTTVRAWPSRIPRPHEGGCYPPRVPLASKIVLGVTLGGRYKILRLLGEGGMGGVYEAEDMQAGRRVAIKVIHRHVFGRDPKLLERFHREARAAAAIDSEHVVRLHGSGTDEPTDAPFIVMELLDGEDLRSVLRRVKRLTVDASLRIVAQILRALEKAHAARVIHRDIKPANVLLASVPPRIVVKLLDFGIAKLLANNGEEEPATLTATHDIVGTPVYMSPEQTRGLKNIDFRSDIWSVGMVLYRCLAGRPGYDVPGSLAAFIAAVVAGPPEPLVSVAPWVPVEVARVVHRALAMNPAERYPTAAEMLADVEALLPGGAEIGEPDLVAFEPPEREGAPKDTPSHANVPSDGVSLHDRPTRLVAGAAPSRSADGEVPSSLSTQAVSQASFQGIAPRGSADVVRRRKWWLLASAGIAPLAVIALLRLPAPASAIDGQASPPVLPAVLARLTVEPTDADVEIDGVRAGVAGGVVELRSPEGTVHQVRVSKGERERRVTVTVTANGAAPSIVALPVPTAQVSAGPTSSGSPSTSEVRAPAASSVRPAPSRPPSTATAAPAPPKPPEVADPLINGRFE